MKRFILIIILTDFYFFGNSSDTIFYNKNWEITSKSNGFYYRISELDTKKFFFEGQFQDFIVKNNQSIESGNYSDYKKNGEFIKYYENGNIMSKGLYTDNNQRGLWIYNFADGKMNMIIDFDSRYFNVIEYQDSIGNHTVINGNGQCIFDVMVFDIPTILTAIFSNGKRNGKWNYIDKEGNIILTEEYKKGDFLNLEFKKYLAYKNIYGAYLTNSYFFDYKYFQTEQMLTERNFNVKSLPTLKYMTKYLSYSNSTNLSYLNSPLPIDAILCLAKDKNNNYYIGTANNGLIKSDSTFTFYNTKNTLIKGNYVSNIAVDKNNKIWFTYSEDEFDYDFKTAGLACLSDSGCKIFNTKNSGLTSNNINDIKIDQNNVKWFATANCIVSYNDQNWIKHYDKFKEIKQTDTIQFDTQHEYYKYANKIGFKSSYWKTEENDSKIDDESNNLQAPNVYNTTTTYYEPPSMFLNIEFIDENTLYIMSGNSGCYEYKENEWKLLSDSNQCLCIHYQLKSRQIISSTQELIDELLFGLYKSYFNDKQIQQILIASKSKIWILTESKLFKITNQQIIEYKLNDTNIRNALDIRYKKDFYYLFKDTDGSIWVCINSGIIKIE